MSDKKENAHHSSPIALLICCTFILATILSACTAAPMVALMGYDTIGKRARWLEYAKDGDVYAQYELAQSYCCKLEHGKLDGVEALKWWCESAKSGYAKSQLKVGELYEHKELLKDSTVPKDDLRAYAWYKLANKRGNEEARENFLRLKENMTPDQIAKAEKLLTNKKNIKCGDDAVRNVIPQEEQTSKKSSR